MSVSVDLPVLADLKRRAHQMNPEIPSAKLAEILAGGLCYRTHASLLAAIKAHGWVDHFTSDDMATRRATEIGVRLLRRDLMTALIETWPVRLVSLTSAAVDEIRRLANSTSRVDQGHSNLGINLADPEALAAILPNAVDEALLVRLRALTKPAVLELTGLMWLGRGDFEPADWRKVLRYAFQHHDGYAADYVAEKSMSLDLYLREGLGRLAAAQ